jgi:SAM-dependent methyltransferase
MPPDTAGSVATAVERPAPSNCVVCGGGARTLVCGADEVRRQFDYARRFHRRRLRLVGRRRARQGLADRGKYTHDYATDIVACAACGLLFRDARPGAETAVAEYAGDYYGAERLGALFESQVELFRGRIGTLRDLVGIDQPLVVEVGSFVGGFLTAARELGWTAVGIDPGEEVAAFCRARGLDVRRTVAEDAPIPRGSADCVAIWNTFDQLSDPRPTLASARRWLKRDGVLVVRVPNGSCFRAALRHLAGPWRVPLHTALAWNNLLGFPYLYGYSAATLDRMLGDFGFVRLAVRPDTLVRLSDATTAAWAAWEERAIKAMCRLASRANADLAPWFDAYYALRN